jgi:glyoxylase-like metal-dependent hydrolase (beta-lactamase superfamily II)
MPNLSWTVGNVRITRVQEIETVYPAESLIPEATPETLAPHRSWLTPDFVTEKGDFRLSIHALAVESQGKRIIVDTCIGQHDLSGFDIPPSASNFLADLAEAGFAKDDVDIVLCTHMHFDHVGWNTMRNNGEWVPTFPNARYLFAEKEWQHSSDNHDPALTPTFVNAVVPIVEAGLADLVGTNHEITEEVRLVPAPGHTPGHVCVMISSAGAQALITGDATHSPVQWAEPGWRVLVDHDHEQAVRTRRELGAEYAGTDTLIIGTHYQTPTAGFVRKNDNGLYFEALRSDERG